MWDNFYAFCTTVNKKFHTHIYERGKNGGAEVSSLPSITLYDYYIKAFICQNNGTKEKYTLAQMAIF